MRNLNLDQLQTLIAIADLGTFAAAAQALHLAPPTVSMLAFLGRVADWAEGV